MTAEPIPDQPTIADILLRISHDRTGRGLGVDRQLPACRAGLRRLGWVEGRVFTENDVPATKGLEVRHGLLAIMQRRANGESDAVMTFEQDRAVREPIELFALQSVGLRLGVSSGREIDLDDPEGEYMATVAAAASKREIRLLRKRVMLETDQRAGRGRPHGRVPYGWHRTWEQHGRHDVTTTDEIDPEAAAVIREAARRLLAGESLRAIAVSFNARGILPPSAALGTQDSVKRRKRGTGPVPSGNQWSARKLAQVLRRPANAALRQHRGEVVGAADWPPILDRATFDRVVMMLNDPSRRHSDAGSVPRWLLSGIAVCGTCDLATSEIRVHGTPPSKPTLAPTYFCRPVIAGTEGGGCGLRLRVDDVDAIVGVAVRRYLTNPRFGEPSDTATVELDELYAAMDRVRADIAEVEQLKSAGVDGVRLRPMEAMRMIRTLEEELASLQTQVTPLLPQTAPIDLPDGWDGADLSARRAVIRAMFERIVLHPHGRKTTPRVAGQLDPSCVQVVYRAR